MDRARPTRYRQVAQTAPRAPPRYLRGLDIDDDPDDEARTNAGLIAVLNGLVVFGIFTLIFMAVQRYAFLEGRDPYKCSAIVNEGRWLESSSNTTGPLQTWQPRGCLLHAYTAEDIAMCLPKRRILFIGGHDMKSLYYATVAKLSLQGSVRSPWEQDERFTGEEVGGVTVEFVWDPYLNSTKLKEELEPWNNGTVMPEYRQRNQNYDPPALFIVGAGIWFAERGFDDNPLRAWRESVDRVAKHMRWGPRPTFLGGRDMILLAPVAQPAWEKLDVDLRKVLMPSVAIDMNKYMNQLARIQGLDVVRAWKVASDDRVDLVVSNHIYNKYHSKETGKDGMELLKEVAERRVDMVLGMRCNDPLKKLGAKMESTCCVKPQRPTLFQVIVTVRGLLAIPLIRIWRWKYPNSWLQNYGPESEVLRRFWRLIVALTLCFYTDRSPIFDHMEKIWSTARFNTVLFWVFVAAAASLQKSSMPTTSSRELEHQILTEWKGAALAIHLVASYLGGSTDFSTFALIFVHSVEWTIELLTSNATRTGGSYFARKLMELNYVVLPLVFMMRTEYVLYKLPALLSFWFVVVYMTIKVRPWGNKDVGWFSGKAVLSAGLTVAFFGGPGAHRGVLKILEVVCGIKWDGNLVKDLVLGHIGAIYVGMVVGWIYIRAFLNSKGEVRIRNEQYAVGIAFCLGMSYSLLKLRGSERWEEWHIYTSLARIAAFGLIKLAVTQMRQRQSVFLVWLGSTEAATLGLMNHAWLAADGEGVLDLGIWGFDNAATLWNWGFWTLVFLYVCWAVRDAREAIVGWVLGLDGGFRPPDGEEAQDRKKDDIDTLEMAGGDEDIEPETSQRPHSRGQQAGPGTKGLRRAAYIILAIWILNWIT